MLNLPEIAARISQPEINTVQDVEDLRALCDTYPYSQVFPLLYLKTLSQTNDIRLDQEVQQFAYRISDRSVLYQLLHESDVVAESVEQPFVAEDEPQDVLLEEPPVVQTPPVSDSPSEPAVTEVHSDIHTESEELTETSSEASPAMKVDESEVSEKADAFDQELTAQTLSAAYSIELEEKKRLEEERQRLIEALKAEQEAPVELPEPTPSDFQTPVSIDTKRSFSSWLRSNANAEQQDEPMVKPSVDSLIDRFIAAEPKISAPEEKLFESRTEKKDFFSPTKKAKESLDEGQLPVSETLAKIFAAQGNYPKAIYAYEQLMLIIPEKKIFFANQIKELQKKINP